jgi:hypothetical protein
MHIMIADDDADDVEMFRSAILRQGHEPVCVTTLDSAARHIADALQPLDILFLDNVFRGAGPPEYGISRIEEFKANRPHLEIVVTTSEKVDPALVDQVIEQRVGFFVKPTIMGQRIDAEIAQRVESLLNSRRRASEMMSILRRASDGEKEGVLRAAHLFFRGKAAVKVNVKSIKRQRQKVVIPEFVRYATVHHGQEVTLDEAQEVIVATDESFKASTEYGFGLNISESERFFGTELGGDLKRGIARESGTSLKQTLSGSWKRGQVLKLSSGDESKGIRRREYYWGLEHTRWIVSLGILCEGCGMRQTVDIRVYVPYGIVETSRAYDFEGRLVEDGCKSHVVVDNILMGKV